MSNTGWKEEFETVDKYDKRRRILLLAAAAIFISLIIFIIAAWASYPKQPVNNNLKATETETVTYKYSLLGESCSNAIISYDKMITELSNASDALVKKIGGSTYAAIAYYEEELAKIVKVDTDYQTGYSQGIIPEEAYDSQMDRSREAVNDVEIRKNQMIAEGHVLDEEYSSLIQSNSDKIQDYKDKQSKLATCVNSANNEQDFSISDVADFESIIAGSK